MGSVKDLIIKGALADKWYKSPTSTEFGRGAWRVKGTYSVGDLKKLIPDSDIENKSEALTLMVGLFFEWLADHHPDIPTCYLGVLDKDGNMTTAQKLLDKGDLSNIIVMKIAHVPETYCRGDLAKYRNALASGELQCGVADVESIFRQGFPLGSSTFEKIFDAVGMKKEYETLATYDETVAGLDKIRAMVGVEAVKHINDIYAALSSTKISTEILKKSLASFPKLEKILQDSHLGTTIPNPGFVLKYFVCNSTTKFEEAGDRAISNEEEESYSGLDKEGYLQWTQIMFPLLTQAQTEFAARRNILNIDGKAECVAYKRKPVITDFVCTPDENRLMIIADVGGVEWAIPTNKEIQRAIFRREGVYAAINEAKRRSKKDGDVNKWKDYMPQILKERNIDLKAVSEHSCNLMAYAIAEVANRTLGKTVFDAKPLDSWVGEFIPYASKIQRQE